MIKYIGNASGTAAGISISSGPNIYVEGNDISDISTNNGSSSNTAKGIDFAMGMNIHINSNKIYNIRNLAASSGGYLSIGIDLGFSSSTGNTQCYNNFIWDVASPNAPPNLSSASGIRVSGGTGILVAHNSVNLNSAFTGGISAAFMVSLANAGGIDLRNNIFVNRMNNNSGLASAISQIPSTAVFKTINYNNYEGTPLGRYGNNPVATIENIRTAFGSNQQSTSIPPVFVSDSDLHLSESGNEGLDNVGSPLNEVMTDIDGTIRSSVAPDMGADEFGAINIPRLKINCTLPLTTLCRNGTYEINYQVEAGTPAADNIYTVQISNFDGSFQTPVVIGTLASNDLSGKIEITIPSNLFGVGFRLRVVSSSPTSISPDNGQNISLAGPPSLTITGIADGDAGVAYPFSTTLRTSSTYAWTFTNGTQNSGGATHSVTATFNEGGQQQVTVTETDVNGCKGVTAAKAVNISAPQISIYVFNGNGNWNDATNWLNAQIPATTVGANVEVIIEPVNNGECILNVSVTFSPGAKLTIKPGSTFKANANLTLLN